MNSLVNELERLQQLHRDGTLSDAEFVRAKAVALGTETTPGAMSRDNAPAPTDHFKLLHIQNQIEQLDREWLLDREKLMTVSKRGIRSTPSRVTGVAGAVVAGGFGLVWTLFATFVTSHAPFPISVLFPGFGVLFVLIAIVSGISEYRRAGAYEKAEQQYKASRAELLAQQDRTASR